MKCLNCDADITEYQAKEYKGCCCGFCENRIKKFHCRYCGLLIPKEYYILNGGFCDGDCRQEYSEYLEYRDK